MAEDLPTHFAIGFYLLHFTITLPRQPPRFPPRMPGPLGPLGSVPLLKRCHARATGGSYGCQIGLVAVLKVAPTYSHNGASSDPVPQVSMANPWWSDRGQAQPFLSLHGITRARFMMPACLPISCHDI
jgi:hypothetical protein